MGALVQRRGQLAAAAIATVSDDDVAWPEHEEFEALGGVPISYTHLDQSTAQQVIAHMHAPVVASATRLLEPGGIDEQDAWRHRRRLVCGHSGRGQQFAYQPQEPGACFAQLPAPGHMRAIG